MSDDRSSSQNSRNWLEKLLGAFTNDNDEPRSRDELLAFLRETGPRFNLDPDAMHIIEGAFDINDMQVREVMIQRSQIITLKIDQRPDDLLPIIKATAHSRYPVIGDSLDEVQGVLLVKDLLPLITRSEEERAQVDLRTLVRPATFVPESKRLNSLLRDFRDTHSHMAIVVDEYGGTAGLITIEDVLEQIVGDIEDEHDTEDNDEVRDLGDGTFAVQAQLTIEDFNQRFGTDFSDEEFDTIGGLVMQRFGHLPERNESALLDDWTFTVTSADNRRIRWLKAAPPSLHYT